MVEAPSPVQTLAKQCVLGAGIRNARAPVNPAQSRVPSSGSSRAGLSVAALLGSIAGSSFDRVLHHGPQIVQSLRSRTRVDDTRARGGGQRRREADIIRVTRCPPAEWPVRSTAPRSGWPATNDGRRDLLRDGRNAESGHSVWKGIATGVA